MFSQKTESTNKSPFNNIEGNTVSEKRSDRQISFEYYAFKSYKQSIYSLLIVPWESTT